MKVCASRESIIVIGYCSVSWHQPPWSTYWYLLLSLLYSAGVIGLQTAVTLLEAGYDVACVAEFLPGDEAADYASPWYVGIKQQTRVAGHLLSGFRLYFMNPSLVNYPHIQIPRMMCIWTQMVTLSERERIISDDSVIVLLLWIYWTTFLRSLLFNCLKAYDVQWLTLNLPTIVRAGGQWRSHEHEYNEVASWDIETYQAWTKLTQKEEAEGKKGRSGITVSKCE